MFKVSRALSIGEGHPQSVPQRYTHTHTHRYIHRQLLSFVGYGACSPIMSSRSWSLIIQQGKKLSLRFKLQYYEVMEHSHIKPT